MMRLLRGSFLLIACISSLPFAKALVEAEHDQLGVKVQTGKEADTRTETNAWTDAWAEAETGGSFTYKHLNTYCLDDSAKKRVDLHITTGEGREKTKFFSLLKEKMGYLYTDEYDASSYMPQGRKHWVNIIQTDFITNGHSCLPWLDYQFYAVKKFDAHKDRTGCSVFSQKIKSITKMHGTILKKFEELAVSAEGSPIKEMEQKIFEFIASFKPKDSQQSDAEFCKKIGLKKNTLREIFVNRLAKNIGAGLERLGRGSTRKFEDKYMAFKEGLLAHLKMDKKLKKEENEKNDEEKHEQFEKRIQHIMKKKKEKPDGLMILYVSREINAQLLDKFLKDHLHLPENKMRSDIHDKHLRVLYKTDEHKVPEDISRAATLIYDILIYMQSGWGTEEEIATMKTHATNLMDDIRTNDDLWRGLKIKDYSDGWKNVKTWTGDDLLKKENERVELILRSIFHTTFRLARYDKVEDGHLVTGYKTVPKESFYQRNIWKDLGRAHGDKLLWKFVHGRLPTHETDLGTFFKHLMNKTNTDDLEQCYLPLTGALGLFPDQTPNFYVKDETKPQINLYRKEAHYDPNNDPGHKKYVQKRTVKETQAPNSCIRFAIAQMTHWNDHGYYKMNTSSEYGAGFRNSITTTFKSPVKSLGTSFKNAIFSRQKTLSMAQINIPSKCVAKQAWETTHTSEKKTNPHVTSVNDRMFTECVHRMVKAICPTSYEQMQQAENQHQEELNGAHKTNQKEFIQDLQHQLTKRKSRRSSSISNEGLMQMDVDKHSINSMQMDVDKHSINSMQMDVDKHSINSMQMDVDKHSINSMQMDVDKHSINSNRGGSKLQQIDVDKHDEDENTMQFDERDRQYRRSRQGRSSRINMDDLRRSQATQDQEGMDF